MFVNDSEEDYLCKSGEVVTTMIPDPMGLSGWYGEEQSSNLKREPPTDYIGFVPHSDMLKFANSFSKMDPKTTSIPDHPIVNKTGAKKNTAHRLIN